MIFFCIVDNNQLRLIALLRIKYCFIYAQRTRDIIFIQALMTSDYSWYYESKHHVIGPYKKEDTSGFDAALEERVGAVGELRKTKLLSPEEWQEKL